GFRAPTVGELYYPFSGNPNLKPERSVSYEVGAERYLGDGRAEISLFWNDLTDLIVYDFNQQLNLNIGKARTRGVELGWRQSVLPNLAVDASYTYLDAENRVTGEQLIRRPHHAAGLGVSWRPVPAIEVYPRLLFVGARPDVSEVVGPVTDPSRLTMDFTGRWQATEILAPYVRLTNAFNHAYDEAAGYPNPGRLGAGGVDVRFWDGGGRAPGPASRRSPRARGTTGRRAWAAASASRRTRSASRLTAPSTSSTARSAWRWRSASMTRSPGRSPRSRTTCFTWGPISASWSRTRREWRCPE